MRPRPSDIPSAIDRAAGRRATVDLSAADAVVVSSGSVLMEGDGLAILPSVARPESSIVVFLGTHEGRDVVAITIQEESPTLSAGILTPLRQAFSTLSLGGRAAEVELAATAVAMIEWHGRHRVCPRCGAATEPLHGGWMLRCVAEGHEHYPRTDPAVIVAITDERDRMLFAHVGYQPAGRYSHLAGYLEPGETLEQAAHREVFEEASLRLFALQYVGSQPWPFPASIMVGFRAKANSADLKVDEVEVTDARWMARDDLRAALFDGSMRLASPGTLSRNLVHDWYGGDPVADAGVAGA